MRFDAPTGNGAGNILAVVDVSCGKSGGIALAGIKRGFSGGKLNVRGDGESCACVGISSGRCRDLYSRGIQTKGYLVSCRVDGCLTGRSALVNGERNAGYRRAAALGGECVFSACVELSSVNADFQRLICGWKGGDSSSAGDTGSEFNAVEMGCFCGESYTRNVSCAVVGKSTRICAAGAGERDAFFARRPSPSDSVTTTGIRERRCCGCSASGVVVGYFDVCNGDIGDNVGVGNGDMIALYLCGFTLALYRDSVYITAVHEPVIFPSD